jgi:hypothetical protein
VIATWLLVMAVAVAAFFLGRGWQATKNEQRNEWLMDEIENNIDLIVKQQRLIRDMRQHLDAVNREWQADRDRLTQRGL